MTVTPNFSEAWQVSGSSKIYNLVWNQLKYTLVIRHCAFIQE